MAEVVLHLVRDEEMIFAGDEEDLSDIDEALSDLDETRSRSKILKAKRMRQALSRRRSASKPTATEWKRLSRRGSVGRTAQAAAVASCGADDREKGPLETALATAPRSLWTLRRAKRFPSRAGCICRARANTF
jgi:hypothetical protein